MKNVAIVLSIGIFAAACVPMESASLTYVSKTTAGLSLSAGTPDTPGIDLTIGFDDKNVAFVPVAVAKACYRGTGTNCENAIYELQTIQGKKGDAIISSPIESEIEKLSDQITAKSEEQSDDSSTLASLEAQLKAYNEAEAANEQLTTLMSAEGADQARITELRSRVEQRPSIDQAQVQNRVTALKSAIPARKNEIDGLLALRAQLSAQLGADSNSTRDDSYSIYGKFSGSGAGDAEGGGLTAGKVFATGIAAQNLTEGSAVANCLTILSGLADRIGTDSLREAFLSKNALVCQRVGQRLQEEA
ncbi:hypothetical protein [Alteriqipengyuania sp. 357]